MFIVGGADSRELSRFGEVVHHLEAVTSTQDVAKDMASRGAPEGTVVVAKKQTQGRGRLGRKWFSPEGGLWFSVIMRPEIAPSEAPKITLLGAVSIARAVREVTELEAEIKWPNDILIKDQKVAGILTEGSAVSNQLSFVLLGVGINVNVDISIFPEGLLMPATSLSAEGGKEIELPLLLQSCLKHLESYYALLKTDFEKILGEWREFSAILGRQVRVSSLGEALEGVATDVDEQGALLLKVSSGEVKTVRTGDLFILK